MAIHSSEPRKFVEPAEQAGREHAHLDERWDGHENCEDLTKCECELVFIGVVYPEFDAGHPIRERDDDHGDEVNEREVFADDCQDLPEVETIGLTPWPDDVSFEEDGDDPSQSDQEEGYGHDRA